MADNRQATIVALNENEQRGEKIYCTMLFKFGLTNSRATSLSSPEEVAINPAASLLFTESVSMTLASQAINGKCYTQANATTVHFESLHSNMLSNIENLFNVLFVKKIGSKEEFEILKEKTLEVFSGRFASIDYKACLAILEFCANEQQFCVEDLATSLEEITFEEYTSFLDRMLHPENFVIFLDGKTGSISQNAVLDLLPENFTNSTTKNWSIASAASATIVPTNDYFAEFADAQEMYAYALKFYFDKTAFNDMFIFLLFASVALDTSATILLDGYTPSIFFFTEEERKIDKDLLSNLDKDRFESLKFGCEMLLSATFYNPQAFGEIVVQSLSQEISILDIFTCFASVSFEDVAGFFEDEYPQVRIGAVHVKKT